MTGSAAALGQSAALPTSARGPLATPPPGASAGVYPTVAGLAAKGRCLVMGVLNVTPDSFSDGGRWLDADRAVEHGRLLAAQGADLVDVGGESTRPGAGRVSEVEERRRVVPVVLELAAAGLIVSIDTVRASVAAAALEAGASIVNDVSGGLADPSMLATVAGAGVPYVLMHWRGPSADMQSRADYGDVVVEVCAALARRRDAAVEAGVDPERVILDPGLGFGKAAEHNWQLLGRIEELLDVGSPLVIGASRKAFLGALLADPAGLPRDAGARDDASAAVTAIAAAAGAWCVRVHDVPASADAVRVAAAVRAAAAPSRAALLHAAPGGVQ